MFDTGLKKAVLGQYNLDRYDFYLISKGYISKPPFQSEAKCEAVGKRLHSRIKDRNIAFVETNIVSRF